jgi:aspartate aminotransferase
VAFQAFGLRKDSGWFRLSAGAVSPQEIEEGLRRVRTTLEAAV